MIYSHAHDKGLRNPCAHSVAFWLKPIYCAFSLFSVTMFIEHLHMLTVLPTLALSLRRFQGVPLLRSFGTSASVDTLSVVLHIRKLPFSHDYLGYC